MLDKDQIIHDLAMLYTKSNIKIRYSPVSGRPTSTSEDIRQIQQNYQYAVKSINDNFSEIENSYKE